MSEPLVWLALILTSTVAHGSHSSNADNENHETYDCESPETDGKPNSKSCAESYTTTDNVRTTGMAGADSASTIAHLSDGGGEKSSHE